MVGLVKAKMWEAVSIDGRLAYRGSPGIRAHVIAMVSVSCLLERLIPDAKQMNKMKKQ